MSGLSSLLKCSVLGASATLFMRTIGGLKNSWGIDGKIITSTSDLYKPCFNTNPAEEECVKKERVFAL